jgi:hypothetical protein
MKALLETARSVTPYLLVEVLLPGGTLIALLLWVFRHRAELGLQRRLGIARITGWASSWLRAAATLREPEGKVIATGSLAGKVASSA